MKSVFNLVFFIVIITIFLFFLCSPSIHGFRTPVPTPQNSQNRTFVTPSNPIYITPSNVRIVQPDITPSLVEHPVKNGFFVGRGSPTGSTSASTIHGIPTEFQHKSNSPNNYHNDNTFSNQNKQQTKGVYHSKYEPMIGEQKEDKSLISQINVSKRKESVGERLCHKIFHEFVSSKLGKNKDIMRNIRPNFLKNPKTGCNLELDMFESFDDKITDKNSIIDGIAIEYNGLQHDQFVPGMHENEEAYKEQQFRDSHKTKICKQKGIILITIDTKIDIARIPNNTGKGRKKFINYTEEQRENNIRKVLLPKLEEAYNQLILNRRNRIH